MELADLDLNKLYSYADYYKWKFEERVELIKGKIFKMSPSPSGPHQRISSRIHTAIGGHLKGQVCEVFSAPFDVRLYRKSKEDKDIFTVLQPDLFVNCDPGRIDERGCFGAPEIVIEILSPSNNKKELKYKHEAYEEGGVKEYWIVDPREKGVQLYQLTDGRLMASAYLFDTVTSPLLPGFSLDLQEVFKNL